MEKIVLFDLGNMAKPVKVFIEKILNAIGTGYEPTRIIKKAEAKAKANIIKVKADEKVEIIKAKTQIKISEIQERGLRRFIYTEGIKQKNIEEIIKKSFPLLDEEKMKPGGMDNDWIVHFFDKCGIVSNEQMQILWAKILAGEANKPGSYSKRTINRVSELSQSDAHLFTNLCKFCLTIRGKIIPLVLCPPPLSPALMNWIYVKQGLDLNQLLHLKFLGLIQFDNTISHLLKPSGEILGIGSVQDLKGGNKTGPFEKIKILYHNKEINLEIPIGGSIDVGNVLFTDVGEELVSICGVDPISEFVDYVKKWWEQTGYHIILL